MSDLDQRSVFSGLMTGLVLDRKTNERKASDRIQAARTSQEKQTVLDKGERRMYLFGAMGAGLLIGLIFLAVFAAAIVLILLLAGKL